MENPRRFADKAQPGNLKKAIAFSLKYESSAIRKSLQHFNQQRYQAVKAIEDYEALKDGIRRIKEEAIDRLPELLETLKQQIVSRGGHFFLAANAQEARTIIKDICQKHKARLAVKSKSMTSEEIGLNAKLEAAGLEVVETDLAEFIIQLAGEHPSHIVVPAIHRTQKQIAQLFKEKFKVNQPLESGEQLTRFARNWLREKFFNADVGITGANVIAADTGTLLLIESEGNIRMTTTMPSVHIALAGVEKVIARQADLFHFYEILAPSATGQPLTSYTHLLRPPLPVPVFNFKDRPLTDQREFYLVLVDNGRLQARSDTLLKEALYCIRCSACLNVCPNFQVLGGHAFGGETYSGGIGAIWEAIIRQPEKAKFTELCTSCTRCVDQCPARINIPWLNIGLKQRLAQRQPDLTGRLFGLLLNTPGPDAGASVQKQVFGHFSKVAKTLAVWPAAGNRLMRAPFSRWFLEKVVGVDRRRSLPPVAQQSFVKKYQNKLLAFRAFPQIKENARVLIFSDVFMNYNYPERGAALATILDALNIPFCVSPSMDDGRAALSQGLVATAQKQALKTAEYLLKAVEQDFKILVVEPSVLAMFRSDYHKLLRSESDFWALQQAVFEPFEFLLHYLNQQGKHVSDYFVANFSSVFYHAHCQQKTIDAVQSTITFFEKLGIAVHLSEVECCGMAGSFGYKKDFYDVSVTVSEPLLEQIRQAKAERIMASGISCSEQIQQQLGAKIPHPIELAASLLRFKQND